MKQPVHVSITGAAGNIGYALCFRIAAGDMLGPDQPVHLRLIEIPPAMDALGGVLVDASLDERAGDVGLGAEVVDGDVAARLALGSHLVGLVAGHLVGERQATFELRANSVINPFTLTSLSEFRCPGSL